MSEVNEVNRVCVRCGGKLPRLYKKRKFCSRSCCFAQMRADAYVPPERVCKHCGKKFRKSNHLESHPKFRGLYCSKKCWDDYKRVHGGTKKKVVSLKCVHCGKEFEAYASATKGRIGRRGVRFCSSECYHASTKKHDNPPRICKQCGKSFVPPMGSIRDPRYKGELCSQECRHESARKKRNVPRVARCKVCGKEYEPKLRSEAQFCSQRCTALHLYARRAGAESHNELVQQQEQYARRSGWPTQLNPRQVQILNVLAAVGIPISRRKIAMSASINDGNRLLVNIKILIGHDLVSVIDNDEPYLYFLSSKALSILKERANEEEKARNAGDPSRD